MTRPKVSRKMRKIQPQIVKGSKAMFSNQMKKPAHGTQNSPKVTRKTQSMTQSTAAIVARMSHQGKKTIAMAKDFQMPERICTGMTTQIGSRPFFSSSSSWPSYSSSLALLMYILQSTRSQSSGIWQTCIHGCRSHSARITSLTESS